MMNRILLFIALILLSIIIESEAQIKFQKIYGGSGTCNAFSIIQTQDEGYLLGGNYQNGWYMDTDALLIKTNQFGDTIWTKIFGGAGDQFIKSIQPTSDSGVIVMGNFSGNGKGLMLIKMSKTDSIQWTKQLSNNYNLTGFSLEQTSDGGYVICGSMDGSCIIKTFSNGVPKWVRRFNEDAATDIKQTIDGGYILLGHKSGNNTLTKLDNLGNISWWNTFGGPDSDYAYTVLELPGKGYVLSGSVASGIASRIFLTKTDLVGNIDWSKIYGNNGRFFGYSLELDSDSGFVIGGIADTTYFTTHGSYLLKTDSAGIPIWAKYYGDNNFSSSRTMKITKDGGYVLGSYHRDYSTPFLSFVSIIKTDSLGSIGCNEANHNPSYFNYSNQTFSNSTVLGTPSIPFSPFTILSHSFFGASTICTTVDVEEITLYSPENTIIYPNPSNGIINVDYQLPKNKSGHIKIYDFKGTLVYKKTLPKFSTSQKLLLEELSNGIYFSVITSENFSISKKIIISK